MSDESPTLYPFTYTHRNGRNVQRPDQYLDKAKQAFEAGDVQTGVADYLTGIRSQIPHQGNIWDDVIRARIHSGIALSGKAKALLLSSREHGDGVIAPLAEAVGTWNHFLQEKEHRNHDREALEKHFRKEASDNWKEQERRLNEYIQEVSQTAVTLAEKLATHKPDLTAQIYYDIGASQYSKLFALAETHEQNDPNFSLKIYDAIQFRFHPEKITEEHRFNSLPEKLNIWKPRNISDMEEAFSRHIADGAVYDTLMQARQRLAGIFKKKGDTDLALSLEQQVRDMKVLKEDSDQLRTQFDNKVKPVIRSYERGETPAREANDTLDTWVGQWNERFGEKQDTALDEQTLNAAVEHMTRYLTRRHNSNLDVVLGGSDPSLPQQAALAGKSGDEIGSKNQPVSDAQRQLFKEALKRGILEAHEIHKDSTIGLETGAWAPESGSLLHKAMEEANISGNFLFPTRTQWYIDFKDRQVIQRSTAGGGMNIVYSAENPCDLAKRQLEAVRNLRSRRGDRLMLQDIISINIPHFCERNDYDEAALFGILSDRVINNIEKELKKLKRNMATKSALTAEFLLPVEEAITSLVASLKEVSEARRHYSDASDHTWASDNPQAKPAETKHTAAKEKATRIADKVADLLVKKMDALVGRAKTGGVGALKDTFEPCAESYIKLAQHLFETCTMSEDRQRILASYAFTTSQQYANDNGLVLQEGMSRRPPTAK